MTRPRTGMLVAFVILAALVALFSWWFRGPAIMPGVSERLALAVRSQRDTVISLEDHAPFAWTSVYLVSPYTTSAGAERAMGISWPWRWNHIAFRDHFTLLVFVDSQRIVGIVEHPRGFGDLTSTTGAVQSLTRSGARFSRSRGNGSDSAWVRLVAIPADRASVRK